MKAKRKFSKGFTLLEIVVVIIIIGVLAATAMTYYFRFLERVRTAEAVQLFATSILAQERNLIKREHYVKKWTLLDAGPMNASSERRGEGALSADETHFYTNNMGDGVLALPGFDMFFDEVNGKWFIVAERIGWGNRSFALVRPFDEVRTYCVPHDENDGDVLQMCADFMGVSNFEDIPADPRTATAPAPVNPW